MNVEVEEWANDQREKAADQKQLAEVIVGIVMGYFRTGEEEEEYWTQK